MDDLTFDLAVLVFTVLVVGVFFTFFGRLTDIRDALDRIATAVESIDQVKVRDD